MMKKLIVVLLALLPLLSACKPSKVQNVAPMKVLVVTDVQRDFFDPSGSLYVKGGELLPAKIAAVAASYDAIIFTMDWHPGNHCSFKTQGGIWPPHCVAYTQGAGLADEFSDILALGEDKVQLYFKAYKKDMEQYGAFTDLDEDSTIYKWLKNCECVDICGIAGDYCVKETTDVVLRYVPSEKVAILSDLVCSIDDGSTIEAFIREKGINEK